MVLMNQADMIFHNLITNYFDDVEHLASSNSSSVLLLYMRLIYTPLSWVGFNPLPATLLLLL